MKKLLITLLLGAMLCTLVACGEDETYTDEEYYEEGSNDEEEPVDAGEFTSFLGTFECQSGEEDADLGLGEAYIPHLEYYTNLSINEDGSFYWCNGLSEESLQNIYDAAQQYFADELMGLQERNGWSEEEAIANWEVDLGMTIDEYIMTTYVDSASADTFSEVSGTCELDGEALYLTADDGSMLNIAYLSNDGISFETGEELYQIQ